VPAFHVHRFYARGPPSPEGMRCGIRAAEIRLCFDDARAIPLIVVPAAKPRADDRACNVRCFVQKKLARKLLEAKRLWVKSKPGIRDAVLPGFSCNHTIFIRIQKPQRNDPIDLHCLVRNTSVAAATGKSLGRPKLIRPLRGR